MRDIQKTIIILLIPCFLIWTIASAEAKPSTRYTPEKAESESVEVAAPPKKGISIWWYIFGAALIAGGVAAAAGGAGGSSSTSGGSSGSTGGTAGTVTVSY